jgi:hypothetical protein
LNKGEFANRYGIGMIRKITIVMMAMACVCSAQTAKTRLGRGTILWSPPKISWPDNLPRPTVPKEIIGALRIANMPIVLEKTKLEDVQRRLGGTIGSQGDAGDSVAWLCFQGKNEYGPWIFWLTSGEIEGLTSINGLQWKRLAASETPDHRCRLLTPDSGEIELPLTLHPGMTGNEARTILGRPTFARGNSLVFCHEQQVVIRKQPYTTENTIGILLHGDIVEEIDVVKVTAD